MGRKTRWTWSQRGNRRDSKKSWKKIRKKRREIKSREDGGSKANGKEMFEATMKTVKEGKGDQVVPRATQHAHVQTAFKRGSGCWRN